MSATPENTIHLPVDNDDDGFIYIKVSPDDDDPGIKFDLFNLSNDLRTLHLKYSEDPNGSNSWHQAMIDYFTAKGLPTLSQKSVYFLYLRIQKRAEEVEKKEAQAQPASASPS
jgi:hypothetical protein